VWEWCWDWYGSAYPSGGKTDPKGPSTTQTNRSLRGGSFYFSENNCRVDSRDYDYPTNRYNTIGFRSVQNSLVGTAVEAGMPTEFELGQNYPNPFNPSTTISYALPQRSHVTLTVFNTLGQLVATLVNSEMGAGDHEVRFDAAGLASGVYLYRLQAGGFVETRKLLLTK
jgi:hypothetical protein